VFTLTLELTFVVSLILVTANLMQKFLLYNKFIIFLYIVPQK